MKVKINRDLLFQSLSQLQSVVEKRATSPVLLNILCHVEGGTLSLFATDMEVGLELKLPVQDASDGKILLPAKGILDIVKELPKDEVFIRAKENYWIDLTCGKAKFNLMGLSPHDYPERMNFQGKNYVALDRSALKKMIELTAFAVSTDATRYLLTGVFLEHLDSDKSRMTGTDGHRLSFVDLKLFHQELDLKRGLVIPKKGLLEILKLLDHSEGKVGFTFERGFLLLECENTHLFIKLMEGEYPNYRQVIPKTTDRVIQIEKVELESAMKRVSLLAHEKSRAVKLSIEPGHMMIHSSNADLGEASEEVMIHYSGEPMKIGFNAKYVLEFLATLKSGTVEFCLRDSQNPGILRSAENPEHTYVIMPMRM